MSARRTRRRPNLEALEERWVPAGPLGPITWINPGDGDWGDPMNWSSGIVPGALDDVIIGAGVVVTHFTKADAVKSLVCDGGLDVAGGVLVLGETSTIADLTVSGGSLRAPNGLSVTASFDWSSGTLGGSTIELFGVAIISGSGEGGLTLDGVRLENHADLVWTGGVIDSDLGTFENKTDGEVVVTGGVFLGAPFINAGSLFVATPESVSFTTVVTTGEVVLLSGGLFAESYVQTAGQTHNEGTSLEVPTYRLLGGSFTGFGAIIGDVENRGTFAPLGGTLLVLGNYDQAIGGTLALIVDDVQTESAAPLFVSGMAKLAGTLVADLDPNVQPMVGAVYPGLTAQDRMGVFGTVNTWSGGGFRLAALYRDNGVDLVVVPIPILPNPGPTPQTPTPNPTPPTPPPMVPGPMATPPIPPTPRTITPTTTNGASNDPTIVTNGGRAVTQAGVGAAGPAGGASAGAGPGGPQGGAQPTPGEGRSMRQGPPQGPLNGGGDRGRAGAGLPPQTQTSELAAQQGGRPIGSAERGLVGRKMTSDQQTESSGLADELFAAFPLTLPEVELPSERELLSTADVAAALIVGGRARANLVRGGSQLSGVATVLVSEDGSEQGADVSPFAGLYVSPLVGLWGRLPAEPISKADELSDEETPVSEEEGVRWTSGGLALAGTLGAGLAVALIRDPRAAIRVCATAVSAVRGDRSRRNSNRTHG